MLHLVFNNFYYFVVLTTCLELHSHEQRALTDSDFEDAMTIITSKNINAALYLDEDPTLKVQLIRLYKACKAPYVLRRVGDLYMSCYDPEHTKAIWVLNKFSVEKGKTHSGRPTVEPWSMFTQKLIY